jgi:hypothetical protein
MPAYQGRLSRWGQWREWLRIIARSDCRHEGSILLWYPRGGWYEEHAEAMLRLLVETTARLERALGLVLPPTDCYVVEPPTALAIQGTTGVADRRSILIGFPERHMSELAGTAAHELAHVLSYRLGKPEPRFLAEGFACYAAERIGAAVLPLGVPLHYHTAWLLSTGVKLRLADLWLRRDYTPELYDLAWSFAAFLVRRFGRAGYFAFYASREKDLGRRAEQMLGTPLAQIEREWHADSRSRHRIAPGRGGKGSGTRGASAAARPGCENYGLPAARPIRIRKSQRHQRSRHGGRPSPRLPFCLSCSRFRQPISMISVRSPTRVVGWPEAFSGSCRPF